MKRQYEEGPLEDFKQFIASIDPMDEADNALLGEGKQVLITLIKEFVLLTELGSLSGAIRKTRSGKQQYKIGKVEDENKELSTFEAEQMFPGSTNAWAEIVPELFPDFPFDDPFVIKKRSSWFKIGNQLRVAFKDAPQFEIATWDPIKDDWVENE